MRATLVHFFLLAACGGGDPAGTDAGPDSSPPLDSAPDSSPAMDAGLDATVSIDGATDSSAPPNDAGSDADSPVMDSGHGDAADSDFDAPFADSGVCDPDAMPQPNADLLTEAVGDSDCPTGMVMVSTFCIDRYEASLAVVAADGSLSAWSPFFPPDGVRVRALSVADAVPQGYISGDQAAAACAEAGKRLCSDGEWLRACRGPHDRVYPYGNVREDGRCNDARATHPAIEYFETSDDWIWSMLDHPCINQLPHSLAHAGAHDGCLTAEGVFDMMGNLHEWTDDPAGTFRGGFYVDTRINGEGCLYRTTAHSTSYSDYSTGFRCCSDPE